MKKLYYILITSFLIGGCSTDQEVLEKITPLVKTNVTELREFNTPNINLEDCGIINPSKVIKKEHLYIALTPKGSFRFSIYNTITSKTTHLVPAGRLEGEGLYYLSMTLDRNLICALDYGTGKMVEIDLTVYDTPGYQPSFTKLVKNKQTLTAIKIGEQFISTGIYTEGRYCVTQIENGINRYYCTYPVCANPTLSDTLKSILYASNLLLVNPEQTRFVCANMQNGCLDINAIDNHGLTPLNEVHLNQPTVFFNKRPKKHKRHTYPVVYSTDNIHGFCDLTASNEYIYALYSGRTYRKFKNSINKSNTILVFDWNGNHIRTYHLPFDCCSISYDATENNIYALTKKQNKSELITLAL